MQVTRTVDSDKLWYCIDFCRISYALIEKNLSILMQVTRTVDSDKLWYCIDFCRISYALIEKNLSILMEVTRTVDSRYIAVWWIMVLHRFLSD